MTFVGSERTEDRIWFGTHGCWWGILEAMDAAITYIFFKFFLQ